MSMSDFDSLMKSNTILSVICKVKRLYVTTKQYSEGKDEWHVKCEHVRRDYGGNMQISETLAFEGTKREVMAFILGYTEGYAKAEDIAGFANMQAERVRDEFLSRFKPLAGDHAEFERLLGKPA